MKKKFLLIFMHFLNSVASLLHCSRKMFVPPCTPNPYIFFINNYLTLSYGVVILDNLECQCFCFMYTWRLKEQHLCFLPQIPKTVSKYYFNTGASQKNGILWKSYFNPIFFRLITHNKKYFKSLCFSLSAN